MYEAKQNKEKVSRRIERGGMQQRVPVKRWKYINTTIQRETIEKGKEQTYDEEGNHQSQGSTKPPKIVNTLNKYSNVIYNSSGALFHNAHMLAATFGGENDENNIAVWNKDMEKDWSSVEDIIRGTNSADGILNPRGNERGYVKVKVNMPHNFDAKLMAESIWDNGVTKISTDIKKCNFTWDTVKNVFVTTIVKNIDKAIKKIPDKAEISYQSTKPDDLRKVEKDFDVSNIGVPIINKDSTECAKFIINQSVMNRYHLKFTDIVSTDTPSVPADL